MAFLNGYDKYPADNQTEREETCRHRRQ